MGASEYRRHKMKRYSKWTRTTMVKEKTKTIYVEKTYDSEFEAYNV